MRGESLLDEENEFLRAACLAWRHALNHWEIKFLQSIAGRAALSQKQETALARIARKVSIFEAADRARAA